MTVLNDPRQIKTREKLHDAAFALFSEMKGDPTIKEVCIRANITRPTFYNHYSSVDHMKEQLIGSVLQEMEKSLQSCTMRTDETYDAALLKALFQHIEDHFLFYKTFFVQRQENVLTNRIIHTLERYVAENIAVISRTNEPSDVNELTIHYVAGACYQCIFWWIQNNRPSPAVDIYLKIADMSRKGPFHNFIS